jgi:tRNA 2-thiouridine synthesizing protein A
VTVLDMRGTLCPIPVIALAKELRTQPEVTLLADDVAAETDVPAWCRMRQATLLSVTDADGGGRAYAVRAATTSANA